MPDHHEQQEGAKESQSSKSGRWNGGPRQRRQNHHDTRVVGGPVEEGAPLDRSLSCRNRGKECSQKERGT